MGLLLNFARLSIFACAFLLVACGPALIETRPDMRADKLPPEYGLVAVQVVSNTIALSIGLDNWDSVLAVDVNDFEKRYRLRAETAGLASSRAFVGALPPGEYALYALSSFNRHGDFSFSLVARLPIPGSRFDVAKDQLTSLGTVIYLPMGREVKDNRLLTLYTVLRLNDSTDLRQYVRSAYPSAPASAPGALMRGWADGLDFQTPDDTSRLIRGSVSAFTPVMLSDGRPVLLGPLGQGVVREAKGEWRRIDTGRNEELTSIVRVPDGYVVAGERGLFLSASSLEGPWTSHSALGDLTAIRGLYAIEGGGLVAHVESPRTATLYRVSADFEQWDNLTEISTASDKPRDPGWSFSAEGSQSHILLFAERARHRYDPVSGAVSRSRVREFRQLSRQPNGVLVAHTLHGMSPYYSDDDGENWASLEIEHTREVRKLPWQALVTNLPVMLDGSRHLDFTRRLTVAPGLGNIRPTPDSIPRVIRYGPRQIEFWGTLDSADCNVLLPSISRPELIFTACWDGRIFSSTDEGRNWTLDRDRVPTPDEIEALEVDDVVA